MVHGIMIPSRRAPCVGRSRRVGHATRRVGHATRLVGHAGGRNLAPRCWCRLRCSCWRPSRRYRPLGRRRSRTAQRLAPARSRRRPCGAAPPRAGARSPSTRTTQSLSPRRHLRRRDSRRVGGRHRASRGWAAVHEQRRHARACRQRAASERHAESAQFGGFCPVSYGGWCPVSYGILVGIRNFSIGGRPIEHVRRCRLLTYGKCLPLPE